MNEMQDKELDDLFRKSLTDPEIPFDPDAWKAMEAKLDADDRRRTGYFWIYAGVVAGIFLLAGSVYVAMQNNTQSLAQAEKGNAVAAAQSATASADHTTADQHSLNTSTGTDITDANTHRNSVNQNETVQQTTQHADPQTGITSTHEAGVEAANQSAAENSSQTSAIKNTHTKNTTAATTNLSDTKKYKNGQQQGSLEYNTGNNTVNNSGTQTVVQKSKTGDAAIKETLVIPQAGTSDQKHVAGNNKRIENNTATAKNNTAEKGSATGVAGSAAGAEKAMIASGNNSTNTNTDGAHGNTNSTATTMNSGIGSAATAATTTTNNNNTDANPANADKHANAFVLRDTTQQDIHSAMTAEAQNTVAAGEGTARTTSDTVIVAADSAKKDLVTLADTSSVQEENKKEPYKRGFSLSLIVNPEYNGTTDFNFYKPNLNLGFNVEYYILPRLSVVSGMIYGQKLYTCDASDYASSPSYMYAGRTYYPKNVQASCGVLDIPVNVRYKFLNKKTFNVYASTGLSSYIMLKENYVFHYPSKYWHPEEYEVQNKNRYLFNIWNVSFGVEKRINDRWSVQAEPYMKIPLKGIGEGDIKLLSTGVYFSLKYYFK